MFFIFDISKLVKTNITMATTIARMEGKTPGERIKPEEP